MIKLSEIIRKTAEEKPQEKPGLISEVIKIKKNKDKESLLDLKKIYEEAILEVRLIMNDLKEGKVVEGKRVTNISEKIVEWLSIDKDMLLSLINNFSLYEKAEDYLYAHSINTSILAINLGSAYGLSKDELIDLCASTLLHDIGILKIPLEIITKPSKLTKEEFDLVKKHPDYGLQLLENIKDPPRSASKVIYEHHERIDGTGYPEGKKGEEISELAKIVAVVEVYEAITHPRPYHRSIPYEGVKMVVQEAKSSFEPKWVKIFLNHITPYPPGSFVLLNNNEVGKVVSINENLPTRPVVEIVVNAGGKRLEKPKRIDLAKSSVLHISKALDEGKR